MSVAKQLLAITGLVASLAISGNAQEPKRSDFQTGRRSDLPHFLQKPSIALNPNPRAPLVALVEFIADTPVRANLEVSDGATSWLVSSDDKLSRKRTIPILGLSPGKKYSITLTAEDEGGSSFSWPKPLEVETRSLPADFPPLRVNSAEPDAVEPGITLFNVTRYEGGSYGLIVAVDETGEVVWYFQTDHAIGFVTQLRNGNLLYLHRSGAVEIDWLGNVVHQWNPTARGGSLGEGAIPVVTDSFHHEMRELPNGNFLVLSTELRLQNDYPSSETDPSAPAERASVAGDVVVEFAPDGHIVDRWSLFDLLDPYRICYGSLDGFWNSLYRDSADSTMDWTHGNAVFYDAADDSLLLSLRHQDALIKVSRKTGALQWILGTHGGWTPPWNGYLLEPEGELEWQYHQHASTVTREGTILLFDNGNFRARPFDEYMATAQSYSRVVEYMVDEVGKTVSQVWSYGGPGDEVFYTAFGGSAEWLTHTGNVLVTDGARITDAEGKPTENGPGAKRWARILEVTRTTLARKVFELIVGNESQASSRGWSVYRSKRLLRLHQPARSAAKGTSP